MRCDVTGSLLLLLRGPRSRAQEAKRGSNGLARARAGSQCCLTASRAEDLLHDLRNLVGNFRHGVEPSVSRNLVDE